MAPPALRGSFWPLVLVLGTARGRPQVIEVYHINPYHFGPKPINMDTGDVLGDLFFDLKQVIMNPLVCAVPNPYLGGDCKNQETVSPDLVVNKLRLQVNGHWSGYAMCNIGLENNTTPFGDPCPEGQYCCVCRDTTNFNVTMPCNATVGREPLRENLDWPNISFCNATAPDWLCWQTKMKYKLPETAQGWWYSTLDYGYCPFHEGKGDNCTWQVESVDKVINKTCHAASFFDAVEAYNSSCFHDCGAVRNTSAPCWVRCFYTVVLGPDAGREGGNVTGMPLDQLAKAWTAPFDSEDPAKGGCPSLPVLSPSAPAALSSGLGRRGGMPAAAWGGRVGGRSAVAARGGGGEEVVV